MPWMVAIHIIFILAWSAGLLGLMYLLAVRKKQGEAQEMEFLERLERKLYLRIATPAAVLAVASGVWLMATRGFDGGWMLVKLALVFVMVLGHVYSGKLLKDYWRGRTRHRSLFYHSYNGIQILTITAIIYLVVSKAF